MADKNFVVKNGLETGSNTTLLGTAVTVTATGNVGINNSSPTHRLSTIGDVYLGNTTIVGFANTSTSVSVGTTFIANTTGVYHTGTMNAASHTVGTSTVANATGVYTGIVNAASHTVGTSTVANATGVYTGIVNAASHTVGTAFTANATVVNAVSYYVGATLIGNATGPYGKTEATLNVNSAVQATNATNLNSQPGSFYTNATNITTGVLPYARMPANVVNTTAAFTISGVYTYNANLILGSGLSANGTYGTAGQVLHSNGTATYWAADDVNAGTVTSVGTGNGLTGGPFTTSGTVSVLANNGITANSLGLFVTPGTGTVVNATGVHVNATYIGTLSANNTSFVSGKSEGNLNVNNATYAYGKTEATLNVNNATTAYGKTEGNLNVNNATTAYGKTEGTLNVNSALTANNSTNLGGTAAASYQLNSTLNANVAAYLPVYAGVVNGSSHTVGTSLIANATGVYHTGTMNAASHTVGTAFTANATVVNAVSYYVGTTLIGNSTGPYGKTEATLNVNNATTAYGKTEGNLNVNNATTAYGKTEGNLNVNSAATLATSRNINGSAFNGSAAITTATWGTSRTITIGSTGKSVDGSAAVSWTLGEIGAAATNQTMFIGTTSLTINRTTGSQTLTGVSIDGSSATFTSTSQNSQFNSIGVGTAASGTAGEIRANNNITAYYTSDAIFKENVKPIENALEKVMAVDGVEFDWTQEFMDARGGEDGYFIRRHDVGVIAQNIEKVLPEVVATKEDGTKAVKYDRIVALLIEAIKDLKNEVDELKRGK
jgi:hypothetical protein